MIKHYCDKCGKEIPQKEIIPIVIRCHKLLHSRDLRNEYCEPCAIELVGRENAEEAKQEYEERKRAIAQRKAEREAKND